MAMRQRFRLNTTCHCEWYNGNVRCIATRVVSRKLPKYRSRLPLWRKQLNQLDHVTSHSVGWWSSWLFIIHLREKIRKQLCLKSLGSCGVQVFEVSTVGIIKMMSRGSNMSVMMTRIASSFGKYLHKAFNGISCLSQHVVSHLPRLSQHTVHWILFNPSIMDVQNSMPF